MNGLPYYKRYPRDFIEGTIGMPYEVKMAYGFVLDLIYMQGGNLPDDARYISGVMGCSVRKWNSLRADLIERGKIAEQNGFLTNYRALSELETTAKYQRKQSENRSGSNKNNDLEKPPSNHTDTDTEVKRDTKVSPKKSRKTGSRLADDWHLPQKWGEWAIAEGWSTEAIRLEADKFKDYWTAKSGKDATKLDWLATWRNWMRNSKTPKLKQIEGGYSHASDKTDRLRRVVTAAAAGTSGKDWG